MRRPVKIMVGGVIAPCWGGGGSLKRRPVKIMVGGVIAPCWEG